MMKSLKLSFVFGTLLLFFSSKKGEAIIITCPKSAEFVSHWRKGERGWEAHIEGWSARGLQIESTEEPRVNGFIFDPTVDSGRMTCRYEVTTAPHRQKPVHYRIVSTYEKCRLNEDKSATCE